jgi:HEPN domain-containing protein
MNVPHEVNEVRRQWVRKAEHDLEAANRIMAIEEGCPFDMVCFHCQQAAEKYLKCLLTCLGIQAHRTHDLKTLAALIPADHDFPLRITELVELNPYAVDVRYADDWREPQLGAPKGLCIWPGRFARRFVSACRLRLSINSVSHPGANRNSRGHQIRQARCSSPRRHAAFTMFYRPPELDRLCRSLRPPLSNALTSAPPWI